MTKITENEIELSTIKLLEKQGFECIYALNIAPSSETPMRKYFEISVCPKFRTTEISVVSKMEPTCKKSLQVQRKS